eukprot:scaffold94259_cov51-Phaeocystis_antarctica.AAC.1
MSSAWPGGGPSLSRMKICAPVFVCSSLYMEPPVPMSLPTMVFATMTSLRTLPTVSSSDRMRCPTKPVVGGQPWLTIWPSSDAEACCCCTAGCCCCI